jgi:hypothetical protein
MKKNIQQIIEKVVMKIKIQIMKKNTTNYRKSCCIKKNLQ